VICRGTGGAGSAAGGTADLDLRPADMLGYLKVKGA
jgi:hypothetical protein